MGTVTDRTLDMEQQTSVQQDSDLQQISCCDQLTVSSDTCEFSHRNCIGNFNIYLDLEGEPMACYGAASFEHTKHKLEGDRTYLYRSKFGYWCIGTTLGKFQTGVLVRSCEAEEITWNFSCPCKIQKWQKLVGKSWVPDQSFVINRKRKMRPL